MTEQIAAIVVASSTRNATRLCNYASTKKKGQTSERFVASAGINGGIPELAEKQMRDNRKRWNKNGERTVTLPSGETTTEGEYVQAYHLIQSIAKDGPGGLDPNNPDDIEKAHEAGIALAADRAGDHRYAAVWTQIDGTTGCIHNHIVIDSIDRSTGRSFDSSLVKHSELVGAHDRVLADLGYQQLNEYAPRGVSKGAEKVEKSEERGLAKHALWEANGREGDEPFSVGVLKHRIRETLAEESFTDLESFSEAARENGVDVQQRGKGITYAMLRHSGEDEEWRPIASSDVRRSSKLGRDFEKAAIEQAAERNRGLEQDSRLDVRLLDGIEESLADKRSIDVDSYESVLKENRIAFDHASDDWAYASMDEPGAHTEMRWRKASSLSCEVTREGAQEIFEYNQGRQARDDIGTGEDREEEREEQEREEQEREEQERGEEAPAPSISSSDAETIMEYLPTLVEAQKRSTEATQQNTALLESVSSRLSEIEKRISGPDDASSALESVQSELSQLTKSLEARTRADRSESNRLAKAVEAKNSIKLDTAEVANVIAPRFEKSMEAHERRVKEVNDLSAAETVATIQSATRALREAQKSMRGTKVALTWFGVGRVMLALIPITLAFLAFALVLWAGGQIFGVGPLFSWAWASFEAAQHWSLKLIIALVTIGSAATLVWLGHKLFKKLSDIYRGW